MMPFFEFLGQLLVSEVRSITPKHLSMFFVDIFSRRYGKNGWRYFERYRISLIDAHQNMDASTMKG